MSVKMSNIAEELTRTILSISEAQEEELVDMILAAKRVFVAGIGRSGLMAKGFAMRLMHAGKQVYSVGEVITPSIEEGDLLIVASGSGETVSLVNMTQQALRVRAKVATLTIYPKATIGSMASSIVWINAPTSKSQIDTGTVSIQPMGSLFEQSLLICMDHIIVKLMEKTGITAEEMFERHANLE